MRIFVLFASLFIYSLCFAESNAERPNLDDLEVRKKIIEQAVEFDVVKKADGSMQYFEPLELSPYRGSAWGALYYSNRNIKGLYQLKDGKQDGLTTGWYENGQKKAEVNFKDGQPEGLATFWYENGEKEKEGNYKDGEVDGLLTIWYENGTKKAEVNMSDGKVVNGKVWLPDGRICPISKIKDGSGVFVVYDNEGKEVSRKKFKDGFEVNEKTKTPSDNSIPLPNLDEGAFPAVFPE